MAPRYSSGSSTVGPGAMKEGREGSSVRFVSMLAL